MEDLGHLEHCQPAFLDVGAGESSFESSPQVGWHLALDMPSEGARIASPVALHADVPGHDRCQRALPESIEHPLGGWVSQ